MILRGKFRWRYDGLYQDDDGSLTGQNQSMLIMPSDGLNNASSSCQLAPAFDNAIQCPLSQTHHVRFTLTELPSGYNSISSPLLIVDEYNHTTSIPRLERELTFSYGFLMTLQVNRTYTVSSNSAQVSQKFICIYYIYILVFFLK